MSIEIKERQETKIKKKIKEPSKYNVIFLNDDVTPVDWVITVLMKIFRYNQEGAESITMSVHNEGSAVVGTYSFEIAEQKSAEVVELSRGHGFPLRVTIEEDR